MGVSDPRIQVSLNDYCQETLARLAAQYGISRPQICRIALETGLKQISVPSGAPAGISLPVGEGF